MNRLICGIDEAGRGPLAGPVTAAAVILDENCPIDGLNDSKKLTPKKRAALEALIKEHALAYGIAEASHVEIDEINILNASLLAMQRAFEKMCAMLEKKGFRRADVSAIVDGTFCPKIDAECRAEPKADGNYQPVMAASILAKEDRDRRMCEFDRLYPEYGYAKHKGYPTKAHREICKKIGPSPIQRKTFSY
ncbi:MAG: ribonuclease HII [Spirochaetaceae bacterium]|nr:ribonuclease HII [Spirochaetaceae bacterium]